MEPSGELPFDHPSALNRPLVDTGAEQPITFGDTVRVRETEETQAVGLAGLVGTVCGETIPSRSGEEVVLTPRIDYAMAVDFDDLEQMIFLPHDVLEFIDHGPETVWTVHTKRGPVSFGRGEGGEWQQIGDPAEQEVGTGVRTEPEPMGLLQRLLRFVRQKP